VNSATDVDVAIAGSGPVGMTLALALAARGVASTLIDRDDGVPCVGSRSIALGRWTLETFARLHVGAQMAAEGVTWRVGRTYFRDTELFETSFADRGDETFPPFVNLGQQRVEEILLDRVKAEPLIEERWNHEIVAVEQHDGRVEITAEAPSGPQTLSAHYLVGCDGQRSTVRSALGVPFVGNSHDQKFLIIDLRAELPFPNERRFFFDAPQNPGRQILIHPQPDNVWRIDWEVSNDLDLDEETRDGRLERRIRELIGDVPYEIVWASLYVFDQRRAASFRSGNVFLAGDAAHVFAPFGGRGMNSGIDDADNLAWKLWMVHDGLAPDSLLDTFGIERGAAADHNLATVNKSLHFIAPRSWPRRLVRDAILRGSLRSPRLRRHVNSGKLSVPFEYAGSPIVEGEGTVAPDAYIELPGGDDSARKIRSLFGPGFVALRFAPPEGAADDAAAFAGAASEVPATSAYTVGGSAAGSIADPDGSIAAVYDAQPGDLVLVRPDGYVAARRRSAQPGDLAELVRFAAGWKMEGVRAEPVGAQSPSR
jgi:3-(3-hydroxy-phenyl)propionate hydroxylase